MYALSTSTLCCGYDDLFLVLQGEQVNSQNSNLTPTPKTLQQATPATSTPKHCRLKQIAATSTTPAHPTPSSSGRRPPLMFASSGGAPAKNKERSKASMALNTIVLGSKKSRIIQMSVEKTDDEQLDSEGVKEKVSEIVYKNY